MAAYAAVDTLICWGPLWLGQNANQVSLDIDVDELDSTTFVNAGWSSGIGGLKTSDWAASGFGDFSAFETGALALNPTSFAQVGDVGPCPLTIADTSADGATAYVIDAMVGKLSEFGAVGKLHPFSAQGKSRSRVGRGGVLHPVATARTTSGTGVGQQLGAVSSTKQLLCALHVITATGGTPSLTVVVQSDDNAGFTSATTRHTFNAATAAGTQLAVVAGPITDDRFRVTWTVTGTTPSFRFVAAVAITN